MGRIFRVVVGPAEVAAPRPRGARRHVVIDHLPRRVRLEQPPHDQVAGVAVLTALLLAQKHDPFYVRRHAEYNRFRLSTPVAAGCGRRAGRLAETIAPDADWRRMVDGPFGQVLRSAAMEGRTMPRA